MAPFVIGEKGADDQNNHDNDQNDLHDDFRIARDTSETCKGRKTFFKIANWLDRDCGAEPGRVHYPNRCGLW